MYIDWKNKGATLDLYKFQACRKVFILQIK